MNILKLKRYIFYFRIIISGIIFYFISINVTAQRRIPPQKPKLVVLITVEQFRYDYLTRFWDKLGDKGFKQLYLYGSVCKNAHVNYMFTQSAPGFASISTGAIPADHGIIADKWYDRLRNVEIDCVFDENQKTIGSQPKSDQCSPHRLIATTLSDELKFVNFKSKVVSIAAEPHAAVLSAGHIANGVYWISNINGDFVSGTYYMNNLPQWVKEFNDKKLNDIYFAKQWETEIESYKYLESLPDKNNYEIGFRDQTSFPYLISNFSNRNMKYEILKSTPYANTYVKDMAIHALVGEVLGKDDHPDILSVTFNALENIGSKFGTMSVEMQDAILKLDKDLEFLLQFIENEVGKENTVVVLTSNHGAAHSPKYLSDMKIPSGQFKYTQALQLLQSYLNALYGEGQWIKSYLNHQIYFDHLLIENSKISLEEVQQKSADLLIQMSGVANVITGTSLQKTYYTDNLLSKMQNSYNQKLSGDLLINLQPGWVEQSVDVVSIHNSAYSYDTHVPLIWYGWKIERQNILNEISITDIAPTLAIFLNITQPTMCTGKAITQLIK